MSWLLTVAEFFILLILLHSVACWTTTIGTVFKKFMTIGVIIGLCIIINIYQTWGVGIELFAATLLYAFACELYIFVFGLVSTCISVSILFRVSQDKLKLEDLKKAYCGKAMVAIRIKRLQEFGLLISTNALQLTTNGLNLRDRCNRLHAFFNLEEQFFMDELS